jgi:hypothetical protein
VHVLTVPQQLLLLSAVDYGFTPLTAVVHASHTQALHSAAKESLRMLYYMPGLGRQINKLDTDKAILAAPDYNCELQLSKYQHAAAALGAVMQHMPTRLPLPTSTDGWPLGSTAADAEHLLRKFPHHTHVACRQMHNIMAMHASTRHVRT